jgi:hypothetical protein
MDFEAASESLDGDRHIASVAREVDLASRPELEPALFALHEDSVASRDHENPESERVIGESERFAVIEGTTRGRKPGRAADLTSVDRRRRSSRCLP